MELSGPVQAIFFSGHEVTFLHQDLQGQEKKKKINGI